MGAEAREAASLCYVVFRCFIFKRWRQEDWVFKVILRHIASSRPAWTA